MKQYLIPGKKILILLTGFCGLSSYKDHPAELADHWPKPVTITKAPAKKPDNRLRIYLTFDDGPHAGTLEVKNILQQENVPASFFEVGYQCSWNPEYKKIGEELKTNPLFRIYNHTYSHAFKNHYASFYKQPEKVWEDILKNKEVLGIQSNITRLPGNNVWITPQFHRKGTKQIMPTVEFLEMKNTEYVTGWNVEWHFNNSTHRVPYVTTLLKDIDEELQTKRKFPNDIVILAHDFMFSQPEDAQKLDSLIVYLKNQGNVDFKLIEEHPALKPAIEAADYERQVAVGNIYKK